jgi:hypothetical protein
MRPRNGLVGWVRVWRHERWPLRKLLRTKIVEPVLGWFEACYDGVLRTFKMRPGVSTRRAIAAADMPAFRTATEMQPPPAAS